jgi:hypothetical protein
MTDGITNIAGIEVPSTDPSFLIVVGVHILLGLGCAVAGILAMLSQKCAGRHPRFGTIYFWCLVGVFVTITGLAAVRRAEDNHLYILGLLSLAAAYLGRDVSAYCIVPTRVCSLVFTTIVLLVPSASGFSGHSIA